MRKVVYVFIALFLLLLTTACSGKTNTGEFDSLVSENDISELSWTEVTSDNTDDVNDEILSILNDMSLKEKVCQMIISSPDDMVGNHGVIAVGDSFISAFNDYPVGGFIFFGENIKDKEQVKELLKSISSVSQNKIGLLPFLCVDEEGGRVTRIAADDNFNVKRFPNMNKIESKDAAYNVGYTIGEYLFELGFNVDFAPVADVLSNPNNTVIGNRAFSDDPQEVSSLALSYARGLNTNNVLATFKHFPGHGATLSDTHEGYAYTDKSLDELMACELIPFKAAVEYKIDMIMVSHISLPNVIGSDVPVSLSFDAITGILKENLKFKGLIVTDSMKMGAISKNYTCKDSSVLSVQAGVDIILMPSNVKECADAIISAVENGDISEDRINESVLKILKYKQKIKAQ